MELKVEAVIHVNLNGHSVKLSRAEAIALLDALEKSLFGDGSHPELEQAIGRKGPYVLFRPMAAPTAREVAYEPYPAYEFNTYASGNNDTIVTTTTMKDGKIKK